LEVIANQLLNLIAILAIVLHMFILTLRYPLQVQKFFAGLFPLITLDVVPTDTLFDELLQFRNVDEESMTEQFDAVGYSDILMVRNMGSMLLFMLVYPLITLLYYLITKMIHHKDRFFINRLYIRPWAVRGLKNALFNSAVDFINRNYIVLTMMSLINIHNLRLSEAYLMTEKVNSIFAIIWCTLSVCYPFVMCILYCVTVKEGKKYKSRFDSLLRDIDVKRIGKKLAILTVLIQIWNKLVIVLAIMLFLARPYFTIITFNFNSLFYIIFMGWVNPFKTKFNYLQTIFDECIIMIVQYHLIGLTDWCRPHQQVLMGNSAIYLISMTIAFKLLIFVFSGVRIPIRKIKLRRKRNKYQAKLKKKEITR
jgi:hypothetical protein